jgi:hypothetical protein
MWKELLEQAKTRLIGRLSTIFQRTKKRELGGVRAMAKYKMTVVFDDKDELLATRGLDELVNNLKDKVLEFIVREVEWHNFVVDTVHVETVAE